jgi:hypothetical protein
MNAGHEPNSTLHEVTVVGEPDFEPDRGWQSAQIYRLHGRVVETWLGPSADGPEAPPACQLKQGTSEIAFLDVGARRGKLGRKTGTVFGELVSFESSSSHEIEVRLAVKQQLWLRRRRGNTTLVRSGDGSVVARFSSKLAIDSSATQAESTAAVLIAASGLLRYLESPLSRLLRRER